MKHATHHALVLTVSILCLTCASSQETQPDTGAEAIAINQVGYRGDALKWFFTSRPSDHFRVLDTRNLAVHAGRTTGPVTSSSAGTNVWQGDFTALTTPGTYVVELEDGTRSWPFRIGEDVHEFVLHNALRGLYVSRCGCAVIDESVGHPPCHMRDGAFLFIDGVDVPDGVPRCPPLKPSAASCGRKSCAPARSMRSLPGSPPRSGSSAPPTS
jgi:hypothetical protein